MAIPSAGSALSLSDIQTEFGGSNPIALSEYYAGGDNVPSGTSGDAGSIPSSGTIAVSQKATTFIQTEVAHILQVIQTLRSPYRQSLVQQELQRLTQVISGHLAIPSKLLTIARL